MINKKKLLAFIIITYMYIVSLSICTLWQNITDTLLYIVFILVGLYDLGKDK